MNATRRRIVASFARAQEANRGEEALRLVGGWSVERSRRRPNREEERFPKKRTEKTGNRGQTKSRFSYSASKGVETNQRNRGARSSLLFQARSILFLKKEKKDSQALPHFRSKTIVRFKDRWIENGENLWEEKERKKKREGDKTIGRGKGQVLRVDKLMHPSPPFRIGFL